MTDHELARRMDKQDEMLLEIRDKINAHLRELFPFSYTTSLESDGVEAFKAIFIG